MVGNSFCNNGSIIPLLFGYIDVVWKRQILKASYSEKKISDFISGFNKEDNSRILDPIAASYSNSYLKEDLKKTSFAKATWYKADGLFYILMILVSLTLSTIPYYILDYKHKFVLTNT